MTILALYKQFQKGCARRHELRTTGETRSGYARRIMISPGHQDQLQSIQLLNLALNTGGCDGASLRVVHRCGHRFGITMAFPPGHLATVGRRRASTSAGLLPARHHTFCAGGVYGRYDARSTNRRIWLLGWFAATPSSQTHTKSGLTCPGSVSLTTELPGSTHLRRYAQIRRPETITHGLRCNGSILPWRGGLWGAPVDRLTNGWRFCTRAPFRKQVQAL